MNGHKVSFVAYNFVTKEPPFTVRKYISIAYNLVTKEFL